MCFRRDGQKKTLLKTKMIRSIMQLTNLQGDVLIMDMKDFCMTMDLLPTLFKGLNADPQWVESLTEEQKQEIVDKVNQVVKERYGN